MPKRTAQITFALLAATACVPAVPAMYRWVDENGVTVYSQTPPPSSEAVRIRKQRAPDAEDTAAARKREKQRREQAFDESEARKASEAERAKQATRAGDERQRAANCKSARENLEKFQNLGRRAIRTADGSVVRPSEEQVAVQIDKAEMQIEEYCH